MIPLEVRDAAEKFLYRYREYMLIQPEEYHPLLRENYKIELPEEFIRNKDVNSEFSQFMNLLVPAFNRLPEADRHLLTYKYLRVNSRNDYSGLGACNAYRAAAELGLSVRNFYSQRNKSLEKLAIALGMVEFDFRKGEEKKWL